LITPYNPIDKGSWIDFNIKAQYNCSWAALGINIVYSYVN